MEGKIWGIMLSILGIGGLITALIDITGGDPASHLAILLAGGVLGAIAFFAGIWLYDKKMGQPKQNKPALTRVAEAIRVPEPMRLSKPVQVTKPMS